MKKTNLDALRRGALRHPGTEEGVACAGTALETRTVRTGGKAFLFLRATDLRLKLRDSLAEAQRLARKHPGSCEAGASGWVKVTFGGDGVPSAEVLGRWIDESHALLAPAPRKPRER